jgi:hypothetical protein
VGVAGSNPATPTKTLQANQSDQGAAAKRFRLPRQISRQIERSPQRRPRAEHRDDCYETCSEAVHALLKAEHVPDVVWEPCCGSGKIVQVLRATGRTVIATDLIDYGCPDSQARIDFLMEWRAPPGVECVLTNPPNKLATEFVERGLLLCPRVLVLQPITFLGAEKRDCIIDQLARVHVFKRRLPMMHRRGWSGPKNTSQVTYAWFDFERDHVSGWIGDRIDWDSASAPTESCR